MGFLKKGQWLKQDYHSDSKDGKFVRSSSQFRHFLGDDKRFPAEKNRYHLYVSLACPWAHRTIIFREIKQLSPFIGMTIVHPHMLENGWELKDEQGNSNDPLHGFKYLYQIYTKADPYYTGRVTVPVLWDKKQETIVSNESADIIRMFNTAYDYITGDTKDFYPLSLRSEIDQVNDFVYENINNGVYKCGFATSQDAYEEAFNNLFESLSDIELRLSKQPYLTGAQITEADWRLFTTLIRFDAVYFGHFKANLKRIIDYPYLSTYLKNLYRYSKVADTVNMVHIKQHYYYSHKHINPSQIVPLGPELEFL